MLNFEQLLLGIPALLLAISVHEFAHGYAAYRLGDPTAKHQGRLTLNPLAHLDPIGAIMLLVFRFGWARPVPINPVYFKDRKRGTLIVSIAGPLSNFLMAWLFYNLAQVVPRWMPTWSLHLTTRLFLELNVAYNLGLAAFNLLPLPPLDGSKIVSSLLPPRWEYNYLRYAQYGPFVLMLLVDWRCADYSQADFHNAVAVDFTSIDLGDDDGVCSEGRGL